MNELELLAIDAGQTGMKVRLRWQDGSTRDDVLPGVLTDRPLQTQLTGVSEHFVRTIGQAPKTLAMGVSGVTDELAEAEGLRAQPGLAGVQRIIVAHDSITSFLGVLGDRFGAVLAAGTGVVTLGVGPTAAVRIDGWGNVMGDAGSGYWIGREALDAVMRAYDGRGPATALTAEVTQRWPNLESAYTDIQSSTDRVRLVASYAKVTAALAEAGDAVARRICLSAASELAHSIVTALRTSGAPADAAVGTTGGVMHASLVRDTMIEKVRSVFPDVQFVPPAGSGLDGAVALAGLAEGHPLRTRFAEVVGEDHPAIKEPAL